MIKKISAAVISGMLALSTGISLKEDLIVSAEAKDFSETMTAGLLDETGRRGGIYSIDIDEDGINEQIGYYHVGGIHWGFAAAYFANEFFYVHDDTAEPYLLYRSKVNDHYTAYLHIIYDTNTGKTFLGYELSGMGGLSLHKFLPDEEPELIIGFHDSDASKTTEGTDMEAYENYMKKVIFLDKFWTPLFV
ncbi:MAG: hypothetical protein ACI4JD_00750 [Ruminococcus sp.]